MVVRTLLKINFKKTLSVTFGWIMKKDNLSRTISLLIFSDLLSQRYISDVLIVQLKGIIFT